MASLVAWHPDPHTSTSPYIARQAEHLSRVGVKIEAFHLSHLLRRNTVVHIHWPEHLARSHRRADRFVKPAFAALVIALLRGPSRARLVWTVHNLNPHRPATGKVETKIEQALFDTIARRADVVVTLVAGNEGTIRNRFAIADSISVVHIPEGVEHPVEPRPVDPAAGTRPVEFLAVGSLISYKGYVEAAEAMADLPPGLAHLHIVGHPTELDVVKTLRDADYANAVTVVAERVADDVLDELCASTDAVFLTNRRPFNSGTPYWALSRNLPVVMVASPLATELTSAFGSQWIHELPSNFGAKDLARAVDWVATHRDRVETSKFAWPQVTAALADVYRNL